VGPDTIVPVVMIVSIAGAVILRGPLGKALAERVARRGAVPDGRTAEIAAQAVLELEDLRQRLAELEERQDFTERMLTRERGRPGLVGGPHAT
jgi:Tfp pilus assembly protein PilO